MIKPILIFLLIILLLYAFSQVNKSKFIAWFIILCCLIGGVFVLSPNTSTYIANLVGVGRGADLIIYILSIICIAAIFNLHLKFRSSAETQTLIIREFALMNAKKISKEDKNDS